MSPVVRKDDDSGERTVTGRREGRGFGGASNVLFLDIGVIIWLCSLCEISLSSNL